MKALARWWFVAVPAVMLLVLAVLLFVNRAVVEELSFLRRGTTTQTGLVDQTPFETAQTLAALAISNAEQAYALEAEKLADHEVDQAFAMALRQAGMSTRTLTPEAAATAARVQELKQVVKDDKARADAADQAAKASGIAPAEGDDADVAKAQLQLDSDELADAIDDLARQSGDQRGQIQQELTAREAAMKKFDSGVSVAPGGTVAASRRYATLAGRVGAWFAQRSRVSLLAQAEARATEEAHARAADHDRLAQVHAAPALSGLSGPARVKALDRLAGQRVLMSILDDRQATELQLAKVYARWQKQVWLQHRVVVYLVMQSLATIAGIALVAALLIVAGRHGLHRLEAHDGRQRRTLETILVLAVEALALVAAGLVAFGVPQQTTTVLGLMTAGLTVVFQDYILAFFGWFVLMGRNGLRVRDWVEIDGVGGEVVEIGLFRTTLLETGNWTSRGHPTGRKVAFTNSFAIRGQYFNYSTHGQWMWDELEVAVPATADAFGLAQAMQAAVEGATAEDIATAEVEWQRATEQVGLNHFSVRPTVDLRPAAGGLKALVRFVTRAGQRFEQRRKIYEAMVKLTQEQETKT